MSVVIETGAVVVGTGATVAVLTRHSVRSSPMFQATVSPLASIMGSGFLVVAPLLAGIVGGLAVFVMAGLCAFAFAIGHIIRQNIVDVEPALSAGSDRVLVNASRTADILLGASYVISVAFYLGLLSDLLVNEVGVGGGPVAERALTTAILTGIGALALTKGLGVVGRIEQGVTTLNLAMIMGLVLALVVDNGAALVDGTWSGPGLPDGMATTDIRRLLGVLIVVQGFEISRYQADRFTSETRIGAMTRAQVVSTTIYLVFIGALTHRFGEFEVGKDALLEIVAVGGDLTPMLPTLIVIAAIGSQLSASIADADGGAGLVSESSEERVSTTRATIGILAGSIALTWLTDLGVVIAIASRFFAAYYATQVAIHLRVRRSSGQSWPSLLPALALFLATVSVAIFALPSE